MPKKITKKTGLITITSAEGVKAVKVPRDLLLFDPPRDFADSIIDEAEEEVFGGPFDSEREMHAIKTSKGLRGTLLTRRVRAKVFWCFRTREESPTIEAGGMFYLGQEHATESVAAARESVRGKGLYTAVLMQLRKHFGVPLVSDKILSAANVLVWAKLGEVDDDLGRFRINPLPTLKLGARQLKAAVVVAKSLILTD